MGKEIEHKYLVINDSYKKAATKKSEIVQGYLNSSPDRTVRVRKVDHRGFITVKSRNIGAVRNEWEYEIPLVDAEEMLQLSENTPIHKTRWIVSYRGFTWEVDEFHGTLSGLTIAEVELPDENTIPPTPPFAGTNVTDDARYYNSNLSNTGLETSSKKIT